MTDPDRLAALVCGDLDDDETTALEEHLLGCDACTALVTSLHAVGRDVARLIRAGMGRAVITELTADAIRRAGLPRGEYELAPGDVVACSIASGDLFNLSTYQADLAGVDRLAVELLAPGGHRLDRVDDVPFDRDAGKIILLSPAAELEQLPTIRLTVRLLAVEDGGDRELGSYVMDHHAR